MNDSEHSRLVALVGAACLALGACGTEAQENGPRPMAEAAGGSELISNRHFSSVKVPCEDPQATSQALLQITSRDLSDDVSTRLLDYATDEVQLADGRGKIAVIVYTVSAEDEEAALTTTEHFLINDQCQVMHWSSAVASSR